MMPNSMQTKTTLYFLLIVATGMSADAAELRLKQQVRVPGPLVLLGDVAEIKTDNVEQQQRLRRLELFPAPAAGVTRVVRAQEIRELLNLHGLDTSSLTWQGEPVIRVFAELPRAGAPDALESAASKSVKPADASASVLVATRDLERGELLREADLALRKVAGPLRGLLPVRQLQDAVGLELTRGVSSGQPLDGRYLQRPVLVRRGDTVSVAARAQGVSVRTTAKALEDGARDDLILLESAGNRQRFSARVVGLQQAEVYAAGLQVPRIASAPAPAAPFLEK
jgi:flagella basal body P-ring formation protein FlgA